MSIWHIYGGNRLTGSTQVQGAKNAVLPIMAASVLAGSETVLHNVPDLKDVTITLRILRHLGCTAERDGDTVRIDSRGMNRDFIPHDLMRELRSSVIFLGAILTRFGTASLSMPGGCELGPRPGEPAPRRAARARRGGHGARRRHRLLRARSEGAAHPAAVSERRRDGKRHAGRLRGGGETVICNAAREPEILDLQCYLRKLGARISGAGTSTVTVSGFRPQPFVEHTIMPDRIVAATILCAGAACGGDVELQGVDPDHFLTVLDSLSEAGCAIIKTASTVRLTSTGRLTAPRPVVTQPYPGFPTDAQPPLMAACLKAKGTTVFTENIFTNRYRHAEEFRRLGAAVSIEGRVAYVTGVDRLTGAPLTSSDLRGGAAMIVAGLSAEGETEILDNGYINRGYDRFDACLSALGADVRCVAPR